MIDVVVIVFFILSIIVSIKYKFVQFKAIKQTKKILADKKDRSVYQTFMVSLASHIGTGNIVGISTALIYGGAGSLFWMWTFAITTSIFSLIENTLAQIYKKKIDGEYRGGSSYYISDGVKNKVLAIIFAIFLVLSNTIFFQPLQVNTISETLKITFGIDKKIILIILITFTVIVIFGGTKRIVKFSECIVPIMSLGYMVVTGAIILMNIKLMPNIIIKIFREAFSIKSIIGGGFSSCLLVGIRRSLFTHEAGLGTMPTISAMSTPKKPIDQGFVQTVGVYFDTLVLCSLTGFVLLMYDIDLNLYEGCDLIIDVFNQILGVFGKYASVFFLLSFALATVVSEYYLGESNLIYLTKYKKNKLSILLYKLLFICGIIIGVVLKTKDIWNIVDSGIVLLGLSNLYAMYKLRKDFNAELEKFYSDIL